MSVLKDLLIAIKQLADPAWINGAAASMGGGFYALLFAVVFAETGLVVTPFLPGDSLLFAVGAVAATPDSPISIGLIAGLLILAAILGDAVNYLIGMTLGPKVFSREDSWLLNRRHLAQAQGFYDKYGGKTIILARFVPIVRTFAPFVAGIGRMNFLKFAAYNVVGGVAWVSICLFAGWGFGNIPFVKRNFELVIVGIIVVSVIPPAIEFLRARRRGDSVAGAVVEAATGEAIGGGPPAP